MLEVGEQHQPFSVLACAIGFHMHRGVGSWELRHLTAMAPPDDTLFVRHSSELQLGQQSPVHVSSKSKLCS